MIISGFPGVGKTYLYNKLKKTHKINDSDSSKFSWIEGTTDRNPRFPQNYVTFIKEIYEKNSPDHILLISSHKIVRDLLSIKNIPFTLVYPSLSLKEEYLERYRKRGSHESFIKLMDDNWHDFITGLMSSVGQQQSIILQSGETLVDVIFANL